MNFIEFTGALELGLVYGLVAMGVYLTFRVIDFPDMSVDGSFPLGAAVLAVGITSGVEPILATILAFVCGCFAGLVTGFLNVRMGVQGLLAGILTMTALYSINLRVMGRPNISLFNETTIFAEGVSVFWVLGGVALAVALGLIFFLKSEMGLGVRATGVNAKVARAQGVRVNQMVLLTIALSNGIVALGGALFAQMQGFADVTLGPGTIIIGLASVMVGEVLVRSKGVGWLIVGCLVGSVVYRIVMALALNAGFMGLRPTDTKLVSAVIIAIALILPKLQKKLGGKAL